MRAICTAGPVLAIMSFIAAATVQPALAFGRVPAPVPEPSPIVAFAAGGLVLAFCLFIKFRAQRRSAVRNNA
jgi:hypothetical protein